MESRDGIGAKGLKTKLIVNYLPQSMTDDDFRELFGSIGQLESARVMRDKATNYSFGYGFIDYTSVEAAEEAISRLNGYKIENKTLKVAYSKPPGSSKNVNLHVTGLGPNTDDAKLRELFGIYGEIVTTKILRNQDGSGKGAGFVLFKEKPHADAAMKALNGYSDGYGLNLQIKVARENSDQQKQHPKFQEYVTKNSGYYTPAMPSNAAMLQYGTVPVAAPAMQAYGGGYGYAMTDAQKAMRGGGATAQRFNPMSRPVSVVDAVTNTLFVYNIGPTATVADMYGLFSHYGRITKVDIIAEKGYAFVHMPIAAEAQEAINNLNNMPYNGKYLQVSLKNNKK